MRERGEREKQRERAVIVNSLKDSFRVMIFMEMKIKIRMEIEREGEMNKGKDENDHEIKIIKNRR